MSLRRTAGRFVAIGAVAAGTLAVASPAEANPSAVSVTVSPSTVVAGTPTTLSFTLTTAGPIYLGRVSLTVADGWTAPQHRNRSAPGYVTVSPGRGCFSRAVSVSGRTVTLRPTCLFGGHTVVSLLDETTTTAGTTQFAMTATGGSGAATVTVTPAVPAQLVFSQQPGDTGYTIEPGGEVVWQDFTPPVAVTLYDAYGNLATGYSDNVAIEADSNWHGTTAVTADPTTATATFPGVADGTGTCELAHTLKTMTVNDTDRPGVSAVSQGYCSLDLNLQGQLGGGG